MVYGSLLGKLPGGARLRNALRWVLSISLYGIGLTCGVVLVAVGAETSEIPPPPPSLPATRPLRDDTSVGGAVTMGVGGGILGYYLSMFVLWLTWACTEDSPSSRQRSGCRFLSVLIISSLLVGAMIGFAYDTDSVRGAVAQSVTGSVIASILTDGVGLLVVWLEKRALTSDRDNRCIRILCSLCNLCDTCPDLNGNSDQIPAGHNVPLVEQV